MASEIKTITSESLEAAYRALTPSQSGFTQDLMASNTIIPVLDLTASAEGTNVPEYQAQAIAFGSQTAFTCQNGTVALANTAGFWRIFGVCAVAVGNGVTSRGTFDMSDGLSTKVIWSHQVGGSGGNNATAIQFDFIVFLRSGDSISAVSLDSNTNVRGSYRQIADVNGTVVNPSGFTPQ
jgi:hypothetical protein